MNTPVLRLLRLAFCLSWPLTLWAQTPAAVEAPAPPPAASSAPAPEPGSVPEPASAPASSPAPLEPLIATPIQAALPMAAPAPEGCRPLTDKAMAADMKAITAQAKKVELGEQLRFFEEAVTLWSQAQAQCDGRAQERAQRNLADSLKARATLQEQLGSGPECVASHKDAAALQDMARQALSERRWSEAAMLFRKAENTWDAASERCTGAQQQEALRRRGQSEIDGHNAESCAPLFERAREHTQKLRSNAAVLSREDKQDASMVAETLWRDALAQCKGAAVQDSARNNAQALARERGTPWVARSLPAAVAAAPLTPNKVTPALSAPAPSLAGPATLATLAVPVVPDSVNAPLRLNAVPPSAPIAAKPVVAPASVTLPVASAAAAAAVVAAPALVQVAVAAPMAQVAAAAAATRQPESQPREFTAGTTRFNGQFVQDASGASYSGSGSVRWANGDVFEGTLVRGQRHGQGTFVWANGQRYSGDWVDDRATGQASVRFANGNEYEGSVLAGVPQGSGRMRYASGDSYQGQLHAGEPQGKGLYVWKNGQQFDGDWLGGKPNGQGKLIFASGSQYQGAVVDGVPHGAGSMLMRPGETYVGPFVNGLPEGQGTYTWGNGDRYVGQWKGGKKHGQGVFNWASGERWEGVYENDVQAGGQPK